MDECIPCVWTCGGLLLNYCKGKKENNDAPFIPASLLHLTCCATCSQYIKRYNTPYRLNSRILSYNHVYKMSSISDEIHMQPNIPTKKQQNRTEEINREACRPMLTGRENHGGPMCYTACRKTEAETHTHTQRKNSRHAQYVHVQYFISYVSKRDEPCIWFMLRPAAEACKTILPRTPLSCTFFFFFFWAMPLLMMCFWRYTLMFSVVSP